MRQNVIIGLLSVCCTLLAVNLYVSLREASLPVAFGQAVGLPSGSWVLATGQTQSGNEAVLYLFDPATKHLGAYTTKGQGIEFKGMRDVQFDFKLNELQPAAANKRLTVQQVKEQVDGK